MQDRSAQAQKKNVREGVPVGRVRFLSISKSTLCPILDAKEMIHSLNQSPSWRPLAKTRGTQDGYDTISILLLRDLK
jgi:hypothetical protein